MRMEFIRKTNHDLTEWARRRGRKPLVLQGARQVGKTFLLKSLGKSTFSDTAYFNFEEQPELQQLFINTKDVNRIIHNLSLVHGREIHTHDTLIIFDEIQECIPALNTLKYFNENAPEYTVAAAGSLLGITLGRESSFPVGKVEFLHVHPLSFSEFLTQADSALSQYLESSIDLSPVADIFFNKLLEKFQSYLISGGMPEAAVTLLETENLANVEKVLQDILRAYELDFSRHAPAKEIARINHLWKSIPSQLAKENRKFLYQVVKTGARAREYENALLWLIQSGLICKVSLCKKPHLPMSAYDDLSAFKIYMVDVGLLRRLSQLDPRIFAQQNAIFTEFKGALAENYILQSLLPQFDVTPRYWVSEGMAEVDFLIQYKNQIIPCEVKSGENARSKSLSVYGEKYAPPLRIRYSLKNLSLDGDLLNVPLFLADHTRRFLDDILND